MSENSSNKRSNTASGETSFSSTMRIDIPPDLMDEVQERGPETTRFRVHAPVTPKTSAMQTGTKYNQLLQSIYDAVIITDLEGNIRDSNVRASEFLKYSHEELVEFTILNVISGADNSLVKTLCQNLQNEKFALLQAYCLRKDQSFFPAEIAVNSLTFEEDLLCFFIRDVTLRRRQEEMLRTEHNAIQNARNGIAITNIEARLEYVNPAIVEMWGFDSDDEILNKDIRTLLIDSEGADGMVQAALQDHSSWNGELIAKRKNGEEFFAQISVACNRDSDGEVVGMVVSIDDISDRKRAEEAMRQSERQRVMLASVGAACHHLGQPATVIMTNIELIHRMVKDVDNKDLQDILQLTNEAAENLSEVLHKLNAVNEYKTVQYLDAQDSKVPTNIILDI